MLIKSCIDLMKFLVNLLELRGNPLLYGLFPGGCVNHCEYINQQSNHENCAKDMRPNVDQLIMQHK